MKTPRRLAILATAATVLAALMAVSPAEAKKPAPPEPTQYYRVTIAGSLDTGEPDCTTGTELIMRDQGGNLVADGTLGTSVPRLLFEAAVPWERFYPDDTGDSGFHGCHGGPFPWEPDGEPDGSPGYLWLYRDGGTITGLMWAFDWYTGTVPGPGKRPKPQEVEEYFRIWNSTCLEIGTPTRFTVQYAGPSDIFELTPEEGVELTLTEISAVPIEP